MRQLCIALLASLQCAFLSAAEAPDDGATNSAGKIYDRRIDDWTTPADYYERRGYVKYLNSWIPETRFKRIQQRIERVRQLTEFRSDWNNAWDVDSRSGDFELTTNTSHQVAQEVLTAIDMCASALKQVIGLRRLGISVPVEIYATQEQFITGSREGDPSIPISESVLGYFWYRGGQRGIRMFYAGSLEATLSTLFHETTHLILRDYCGGHIPTWANEGLAVFFEDAQRTERGLDLKAIPFTRLWSLQHMLKQGELDLNRLVSLNGAQEYSGQYYPQGWGLLHFLLFYKDGRAFRRQFERMYLGFKKQPPRPDQHIEHFKATFGVEPNELYDEWKAYIMDLDAEDLDDHVNAAKAATASNFLHWQKAQHHAHAALEMDDDDPDALLANARLHLQHARWLGDHPASVQAAEQALPFFEQWSEDRSARLRKRRGQSILHKTLAWNDYAQACVYARQYDRALDIVEDIFEVDDLSSAAYRTIALLQIRSTNENLRDLEAARQNLEIAKDLSRSPRNLHIEALLAAAENDDSRMNELLGTALQRDRYGFGSRFYPREQARLSGKLSGDALLRGSEFLLSDD